jgi:hypothetical protein
MRKKKTLSPGKVDGRPRKELEALTFDGWAQLDALILWASEEYCADVFNMNIETLALRIKERTGFTFPEYKESKKELLRINLRKKQYDLAMAGNVPLLIWLGKNELGQIDRFEEKQKQTQISLEDFLKENNPYKKEVRHVVNEANEADNTTDREE